jgi:hypothetical protein
MLISLLKNQLPAHSPKTLISGNNLVTEPRHEMHHEHHGSDITGTTGSGPGNDLQPDPFRQLSGHCDGPDPDLLRLVATSPPRAAPGAPRRQPPRATGSSPVMIFSLICSTRTKFL